MTNTLVIGAGPAGLATGACLLQHGVQPLVIDRAPAVAASWRGHYERLRLHTVKSHSALPGLPFPANAPPYVPRQSMVDYLTAYANHHRLGPQPGHDVTSIAPGPAVEDDSGTRWIATTASGREFHARHVVIATGASRRPVAPDLPGQVQFKGRILHSRDYRSGLPFAGQRVLVVGMGNTGAEIALDLCEHGALAAVSARSPLNIVYRDVLGRPTQLSSIALARLPATVGDALATLLRNLTVGDLSRWGIRTAAASPLRQLREEGRTPVIDVGTIARIKTGEIKVYPGISSLLPDGARFVDGTEAAFDTVLCATGYSAALPDLFPYTPLELDGQGMPLEIIGQGPLAGLYFVGFDIRQPGGLLRAIGGQAQVVAGAIGRRPPLPRSR